MTPAKAVAPKVEEPADADPREFLLDVDAGTNGAALTVKTRYYACDDANTFCIPVTQSYAVHLEADRNGGRSFERGGGEGDGRGPGGGNMVERMMRFDQDGDGKISREEAPERMRQRFDRMDSNGDGVIDEDEIKAMAERFRGRRGGRTPGAS